MSNPNPVQIPNPAPNPVPTPTLTSDSTSGQTGSLTCKACGASFDSQDERQMHNQILHPEK
jgi:hypothetical protein